MRALVLTAFGGLENLQVRDDVPEPIVSDPHDVRIRIEAVALNRLDLFVVGGLPGPAWWSPLAPR
jgi:NADPH:quinone reductase-like Zn-dependent oxidoreductase